MDKNIFLDKMANILDEDNVAMEDSLEDFEGWDSLAVVSLLSWYAEVSENLITLESLRSAETIEDLYKLL